MGCPGKGPGGVLFSTGLLLVGGGTVVAGGVLAAGADGGASFCWLFSRIRRSLASISACSLSDSSLVVGPGDPSPLSKPMGLAPVMTTGPLDGAEAAGCGFASWNWTESATAAPEFAFGRADSTSSFPAKIRASCWPEEVAVMPWKLWTRPSPVPARAEPSTATPPADNEAKCEVRADAHGATSFCFGRTESLAITDLDRNQDVGNGAGNDGPQRRQSGPELSGPLIVSGIFRFLCAPRGLPRSPPTRPVRRRTSRCRCDRPGARSTGSGNRRAFASHRVPMHR